jgi:hypothetical protein
MIADNLYNN